MTFKMKDLNIDIKGRPALPRSEELRKRISGGSGGSSVVISGNSGTSSDPLSHRHANKADLDQITTDAQGYEYLTRTIEVENEEGIKEFQTVTEKVKAGYSDIAENAKQAEKAAYADVAHDLTEDSPVRDEFLSKIKPDTAERLITFLEGLEVGQYEAGASGGCFKMNSDGHSYAEVAKLYVRIKAFFEELTVIRARVLAGKQYITAGGGVKCTAVEETDLVYRCWFLTAQDGEKTDCKFIAGDQAVAQMFNAREGTANKVSNSRFWRLVVDVNNDAATDVSGNHYGYIDLSKTDCESGSDAPKEGDEICQLGYKYNDNPERQTAMIFSTVDSDSPCIKMYSGINSYSLAGKAIISFGRDPQTGKIFFRLGADNATQYLEYTQDRGLTVAGKIVSKSTLIGDGDDFRPLDEIISETVSDVDTLFIQTNSPTNPPELPTVNAVTGQITNLNGWSTTAPPWQNGMYMWQCTYTRYGDGGATFAGPTCIAGATGQQGPQGVPGDPGADGTTYYTWIRYANDAQGNGISNSPTGKAYIGFAYNKTTSVESNNPADYAWSEIKGEQGVPGPVGPDGKTYYTWIQYSDNANGTPMYQQPNANTKYIGIAVNKETATEGTNPADYTWSLFKGADGDGITITSQSVKYSTAHTATQPADNTFTLTAVPTLNAGEYLWSMTTVTYSNGQSTKSYAVSRVGADGINGHNAKMSLLGLKDFLKANDYYSGAVTLKYDTNGNPYIYADQSKIAAMVVYNPNLITFGIEFKPNTQYCFKAKADIEGITNAASTGWIFGFQYTDDTTNSVRINPTSTPQEANVISTAGKSIKRLWFSYGENNYLNIRAVSVTEGADVPDGYPLARIDGFAPTITSTSVTYAKTTANTQPADSAFTYTSIGAVGLGAGDYLWTKTEVTYSDGSQTKSYTVSRIGSDGADGLPGAPGENGKTTYVHYAYANSANGQTGFSTTYFSGALYVGVCTDYNQSDPTTYTSYEWARLKGEDGTAAKIVVVNADATAFVYSNDFATLVGPTSINLSATLQGTTGYQWSYKLAGQTAWITWPTSGGTTANVILDHNGIFGTTARSITIRCTSGGVYDEVTIVKVSSGSNGEDGSSYAPNLIEGTDNSTWKSINVGQYFSVVASIPVSSLDLKAGDIVTFSMDLKSNSGKKLSPRIVLLKNGTYLTIYDTASNIFVQNGEGRLSVSGIMVDGIDTIRLDLDVNKTATTHTSATVEQYRAAYFCKGNSTDWVPAASEMLGQDAYTVLLTNESHIFEGDTEKAVAASTASQVIAYKGATQVAATIGTITGMPAGMTVAKTNNSTTSAMFTVSVTTALTTKQGTLNVPVIVDGKTFTQVFSWSLSLKGKDGRGIAAVVEEYALSATTTAPADSAFGTSIPTMTDAQPYLWNREKTTYTDNTSATTAAVMIGVRGQNGAAGATVVSVTNYYLASSKASGVTTAASEGWVTNASATAATMTADKPYLWNYEVTKWSKGSDTSTTPHVVGKFGKDYPENLLLKSETIVNNNNYNIANYYLAEIPVVGEAYTFTLWGELAAAKTAFGIYNSGGSVYLTSPNKIADGVYSASFSWRNSTVATTVTPTSIKIYTLDSTQSGTSSISRVKLEKGSNASPVWTPALSEMGGPTLTEEYYLSTSQTSLSGGSWQSTVPTWSAGKYIWTRTKIETPTGKVTYTDAVCTTGATGTSVLAEYSADGTNWHPVYAAGDIWMHTSNDGGSTWGPAVRIQGASYSPNLLKNTENRTVTAGSSETHKYSIYYLESPLTLQAGDKITLSVENIEVLAGNISIIDAYARNSSNANVGNLQLSKSKHYATLTAVSAITLDRVAIFAGESGATNGVSVRFDRVMLVKGDTPMPWTPAASEMVGQDGQYLKYQWAKNSDPINPPTSGWQDTPLNALAGEYVWMRSGIVIPPATTPAAGYGTAIRLTGDTGASGKDTYRLDLSNEVAGVAFDSAGAVTGSLPTSSIKVYKGSTVDSGWTFTVSYSGCTASISDSTLSINSLTADTATATVTATKSGAPTLTATMSVYKVKPGASYSPNMLKETESKTLSIAASTYNYSAYLFDTPLEVKVGDKFTFSVEDIEVLAGNPTEFSVYLYNDGSDGSYGSNLSITKAKPYATLTVNKATTAKTIIVYAGKSGQTAGNSVKFTKAMLVKGDTPMPWSPAASEMVGTPGAPGTPGTAAVVYSIGLSVDNVTRNALGNLSSEYIDVTKYRTTGAAPRTATTDKILKMQRMGIDTTEQVVSANGGVATTRIPIPANCSAFVFTLYDTNSAMLDRERVPIIQDAPVETENLARNSFHPTNGNTVTAGTDISIELSDALKKSSIYTFTIWGTLSGTVYFTPVPTSAINPIKVTPAKIGEVNGVSVYSATYSIGALPVAGATSKRWKIHVGNTDIDSSSANIDKFKVELGTNTQPFWTENHLDIKPLIQAMRESTTIDGGLVLTSLIQLGYTKKNGEYVTMSGINGVADPQDTLAVWTGGEMIDKAKKPTNAKAAKAAMRHNGTAYFCDNTVRMGPNAVEVGDNVVLGEGGLTMAVSTGEVLRIGDVNVETIANTRPSSNNTLNGKTVGGPFDFYIVNGNQCIPVDSGGLSTTNLNFNANVGMRLSGALSFSVSPNLTGIDNTSGFHLLLEILVAGEVVCTSSPILTTNNSGATFTASGINITHTFTKEGAVTARLRSPYSAPIDASASQTVINATATFASGSSATFSSVNKTVLGGNGFLAIWGQSKVLMSQSGIELSCGHYGLLITQSGFKINRGNDIWANWTP